MSLSFLPWVMYVLIAFSAAIAVFIYAGKVFKTEPRTYVIGLMLLGIGGIVAGTYKLLNVFSVLIHYTNLLLITGIFSTFPGVILLFVAGFKKTKYSVDKRRKIFKIIITLAVVLLLCGILVIYSYNNQG